MNRLEEMRLITACALADDRRAFGRLVEAYQPQLRRFFLNLTIGDEMLTDDLAQETFIKAYLAIRSFRGMASFKTWLFRIGYNEFYSAMRAHREQPTDVIPDTPTHAQERADDAHLTVMQAMRALSDVERTVVTLFYIEDQTTRRISAILQIPENTVKSHLRRAKAKMAQVVDFENINNVSTA